MICCCWCGHDCSRNIQLNLAFNNLGSRFHLFSCLKQNYHLHFVCAFRYNLALGQPQSHMIMLNTIHQNTHTLKLALKHRWLLGHQQLLSQSQLLKRLSIQHLQLIQRVHSTLRIDKLIDAVIAFFVKLVA